MLALNERMVDTAVIPLVERIRAGHNSAHEFAYFLEYLIFHMPEPRLVPALWWLVSNRVTGQKFLDFVNEDCSKSGLELVRELTRRIEREANVRPLFAEDIRR